MDWSGIEMGPKLAACDERERAFVWHVLTDADGNATEAARLAGYQDGRNARTRGSPGALRVQAHALMHRERVLQAIEEVGRQQFRTLLVPAIVRTRALLENPDHPDHSKMLQSMLSRLGFGERSGVDVNVAGEVVVNHTDAAVEQLRILKGLGVPREKLVEMFGFSGLGRYEKMLGKVEGRGMKVIDHVGAEDETRETDGGFTEGVADAPADGSCEKGGT
jgi:hypothetical protein